MNKNKIQVFKNTQFGEIRTIEIDGQPWWVLKDVCKILALKNVTETSRRLDDDERCSVRLNTLGGNQSMTVISESGLYAVILRSDKPNAHAFRKWLTSEVIPCIRKTGAYVTDELLDKLADREEERNALFNALVQERKERRADKLQFDKKCKTINATFDVLKAECDILEDCIEAILPKADYCDTILMTENAFPVSVIASCYGMSAVTFNRLLHEAGIQRKVGGVWILYSRHNNNGYTVLRTYKINETESSNHTYWTQSGRKFIYDTLKMHNILPEVERL